MPEVCRVCVGRVVSTVSASCVVVYLTLPSPSPFSFFHCHSNHPPRLSFRPYSPLPPANVDRRIRLPILPACRRSLPTPPSPNGPAPSNFRSLMVEEPNCAGPSNTVAPWTSSSTSSSPPTSVDSTPPSSSCATSSMRTTRPCETWLRRVSARVSD